jgi:hypothetical protein
MSSIQSTSMRLQALADRDALVVERRGSSTTL